MSFPFTEEKNLNSASCIDWSIYGMLYQLMFVPATRCPNLGRSYLKILYHNTNINMIIFFYHLWTAQFDLPVHFFFYTAWLFSVLCISVNYAMWIFFYTAWNFSVLCIYVYSALCIFYISCIASFVFCIVFFVYPLFIQLKKISTACRDDTLCNTYCKLPPSIYLFFRLELVYLFTYA